MRNKTIDFLRGIALITIILIHSLVPYLANPVDHQLWNVSQFAVQIFVFCSGYLFFTREFESNEKTDISYITKRLRRLLIPYYVYVIAFLTTLFLTQRSQLSTKYVASSFLMTGGVDIGWLVILFIQFIFILLFFKYSLKNNKFLFFIYFFISLLSSILLLFFKFPFDYKLIMWLPWALILIYAYYFKRYESNSQMLLKISTSILLTFILSFMYLKSAHRSIVFFDNKYPPNVFYLSYGLLFVPFLYNIGSRMKDIKYIDFFSRHSYSLYFIHYLVIYILNFFRWPRHMPSFAFFGIVLTISSVIQFCFNKAKNI